MRQSRSPISDDLADAKPLTTKAKVPHLGLGVFARANFCPEDDYFVCTKRNYIIRNDPILQQQIDFDSALPQ
jgi:hypothetical protein